MWGWSWNATCKQVEQSLAARMCGTLLIMRNRGWGIWICLRCRSLWPLTLSSQVMDMLQFLRIATLWLGYPSEATNLNLQRPTMRSSAGRLWHQCEYQKSNPLPDPSWNKWLVSLKMSIITGHSADDHMHKPSGTASAYVTVAHAWISYSGWREMSTWSTLQSRTLDKWHCNVCHLQQIIAQV